jgi:hypothetical protein
MGFILVLVNLDLRHTMTISRFLKSLLLIGVISTQSVMAQQQSALPSSGFNAPAAAQPSPQVAMIMLRVEHNKGKDFIVTPKGLRAQVPGKGISSKATAVAVYQDPQQNYWYIDKNGEPTAVRPQVLQSVMAQFNAEVQQRQTVAPLASGVAGTAGGAPVQQTTIINQPAGGGSGGGGGAMGMASMAMSGTALGMSIGALSENSNHGYYGVPYGKPIYQDNHRYYYNNDSKKAYIAPNSNNKEYFNQFNKQGNWNDRQNWQKNVHPIDENRFARGGRFRR